MRILLIEDDQDAAAWLVKGLNEAGHVTDHAADGEDGLALARERRYDVMIVDRMLPKIDGLVSDPHSCGPRGSRHRPSFCRRGRSRREGQGPARRRRRLPRQALCLLRTAGPRREPGAATGRRTASRPASSSTTSRWISWPAPCAAQARLIVLQPREFKLLEYLMRNAGQVVTRTMLLENVWDYHFDPQTNVIDVHMCPGYGARSTRTSTRAAAAHRARRRLHDTCRLASTS
jgi:two-component system, OmpR family, response regulator